MRNYGKNTRRYASGGTVQITPWYEYSREEVKKADKADREKYDKSVESELEKNREIDRELPKDYDYEGDPDPLDEEEGV